jgi:hypothetical protein
MRIKIHDDASLLQQESVAGKLPKLSAQEIRTVLRRASLASLLGHGKGTPLKQSHAKKKLKMEQKDELATLSPQRTNPYAAKPEDFEIIRDDDKVFHGQRSDSLQKECDKAMYRNFAVTHRSKEVDDANKPHTP